MNKTLKRSLLPTIQNARRPRGILTYETLLSVPFNSNGDRIETFDMAWSANSGNNFYFKVKLPLWFKIPNSWLDVYYSERSIQKTIQWEYPFGGGAGLYDNFESSLIQNYRPPIELRTND